MYWTYYLFEQDLAWEDELPDGGKSLSTWLVPLAPVAPDLILKDGKGRCFWYNYENSELRLLNLAQDISVEEWKSEVFSSL